MKKKTIRRVILITPELDGRLGAEQYDRRKKDGPISMNRIITEYIESGLERGKHGRK